MRVTMIGGGYVGLVSGACFASIGADVTIVETDPARIGALRKGMLPIYEAGLDDLVAENLAAGRLRFTDSIQAVAGANIVFLAVGTPASRGDGHADLSYLFDAAEQVAPCLTGPTVLVTKSTVPVGTGRRLGALMAERRPDLCICVAANPEFLREGNAIEDFLHPDRIIIGTSSEAARSALAALYEPLTHTGGPLINTQVETAELIKYAANAFLALKISFINEIADLCEKLDANVDDTVIGLGLDRRIGPRFLQPGPGFGGSCFPKDTQALVRIAQDAGAPARLVETVVAVNDARKAAMAGRVITAFGGSVRGRRITILGLTFKPGTDDVRESPAITIIHRLVEEGAIVSAYDPMGINHARFQLPSRTRLCESAGAALEGADAVVIVTEWTEFRALSIAELRANMRGRLIIDLRNILDAETFRAAGFNYRGIGRPSSVCEAQEEPYMPLRARAAQ
ncbi:MAG: UDP-glucose/GDP-mannose dehydrogenase family protein [Acidocella sp.]|nr:UDP-glucose/GDP-mannose dehydrogenase family protein [Acidocella sp.]